MNMVGKLCSLLYKRLTLGRLGCCYFNREHTYRYLYVMWDRWDRRTISVLLYHKPKYDESEFYRNLYI